MSLSTNPKPVSFIRAILQAEGAAIAVCCTLIFATSGGSWLLYAALLLAPDLFMLGYLAGNRVGAICYNVGHSYLTPLSLAAIAHLASSETALGIALIWGAHIGLDRAIGYGLKYAISFKATHLARV